MEKNKKSQRWGGEGWRPIVCVMPKSNGKQAPPLSFAFTPTVTREARHSPPSPLRKKSRFAKKKSASPKKNRAYHFSKSRIHQRGEPRLTFFSKSRIYRIYQIAARGKPPSEMAYCGPCKRGEAERSLETAAARAMSLERVGRGKPPQVGTSHP